MLRQVVAEVDRLLMDQGAGGGVDEDCGEGLGGRIEAEEHAASFQFSVFSYKG